MILPPSRFDESPVYVPSPEKLSGKMYVGEKYQSGLNSLYSKPANVQSWSLKATALLVWLLPPTGYSTWHLALYKDIHVWKIRQKVSEQRSRGIYRCSQPQENLNQIAAVAVSVIRVRRAPCTGHDNGPNQQADAFTYIRVQLHIAHNSLVQ